MVEKCGLVLEVLLLVGRSFMVAYLDQICCSCIFSTCPFVVSLLRLLIAKSFTLRFYFYFFSFLATTSAVMALNPDNIIQRKKRKQIDGDELPISSIPPLQPTVHRAGKGIDDGKKGEDRIPFGSTKSMGVTNRLASDANKFMGSSFRAHQAQQNRSSGKSGKVPGDTVYGDATIEKFVEKQIAEGKTPTQIIANVNLAAMQRGLLEDIAVAGSVPDPVTATMLVGCALPVSSRLPLLLFHLWGFFFFMTSIVMFHVVDS